jgi:hypothetical protein
MTKSMCTSASVRAKLHEPVSAQPKVYGVAPCVLAWRIGGTAAALAAGLAFAAAIAQPARAGDHDGSNAEPVARVQPVVMPYVQRSDGMWVAAPSRQRLLERSVEPLPNSTASRSRRQRLFERSVSDPPPPRAAGSTSAHPLMDPARPEVVLGRDGKWRYRNPATAADQRRRPPRSDRPSRTDRAAPAERSRQIEPRWPQQREVDASPLNRERIADGPRIVRP